MHTCTTACTLQTHSGNLSEQYFLLVFVVHFYAATSVYDQFGLCQTLVVQLIEQLPNAEWCCHYSFQAPATSQPVCVA